MLDPNNSPIEVISYSILGTFFFVVGVYLTLFSAVLPYKFGSYKKAQFENIKSAFTVDDALILPGRISHTRLFPKFHSFTYSYLMAGIPIHSNNQENSLLSVDERPWFKRGWLRVEANDHLGRGGNEHGIRRKLESYLISQVWCIGTREQL